MGSFLAGENFAANAALLVIAAIAGLVAVGGLVLTIQRRRRGSQVREGNERAP